MRELAYVNGEISPIDEARISVRDRGFIFGDGVYDVVRLEGGIPFQIERHLDRLQRGADRLGIEDLPSSSRFKQIADNLIGESDLTDGMLYFQVTRGVARRQAHFPDDVEPTVMVTIEELRKDLETLRQKGGRAVFARDIRWDRNHIKTINLLPKVLMRQKARQKDAYEALYVDEDDFVWEGASTNLFVVDGNRLITPPSSERILPGITRRNILEIASKLGIEVREQLLEESEVREADELFVTGTLTQILGIVDLEGQTIGDGQVGPLTRQLKKEYEALDP